MFSYFFGSSKMVSRLRGNTWEEGQALPIAFFAPPPPPSYHSTFTASLFVILLFELFKSARRKVRPIESNKKM